MSTHLVREGEGEGREFSHYFDVLRCTWLPPKLLILLQGSILKMLFSSFCLWSEGIFLAASKWSVHLLFPLDMISQLFLLYKNPVLPPPSPSILPAEVDPREVFMRAALKYVK